jgi:hypothetical protein
VYANRKKSSAAAQRSAERRKREDDAPRLRNAFPQLASLRIAVTEDSSGGRIKHIKHIVVDRAPALFVIACGDERCAEGGHDVTSEVMHTLRARLRSSDGDTICCGSTGSAPCNRRVHYEVAATYRAD